MSIFILVILFFVGYGYKVTHLGNEGPGFATNERELETVIFEKDSENRGYSDIVKEKIEKEFSINNPLSDALKKEAKSYRQLLRSRTSEEFIKNHKNTILESNCVFYLLKQKDDSDFNKSFLIIKNILDDNNKMQDYYEYLSLVRFGQEDVFKELGKWISSSDSSVRNDKEYREKCIL